MTTKNPLTQSVYSIILICIFILTSSIQYQSHQSDYCPSVFYDTFSVAKKKYLMADHTRITKHTYTRITWYWKKKRHKTTLFFLSNAEIFGCYTNNSNWFIINCYLFCHLSINDKVLYCSSLLQFTILYLFYLNKHWGQQCVIEKKRHTYTWNIFSDYKLIHIAFLFFWKWSWPCSRVFMRVCV